jgi:hypothetical protein
MTKNIFSSVSILALGAALTLGACGSPTRIDPTLGQYWQRSSVSDAAYMQGPKAQQMLNQDIANCVVEMRELEHLGQLRDAIPANIHSGLVLSKDEMALANYEEPERQRYLLSEHGNYHDFETCMIANGWERVKSVPFDVAHRARENYMKNHVDYEYKPPARRETDLPSQDEGEYKGLND